MGATTAWKVEPTLDTDAHLIEHLARHGVFEVADAQFDKIERGESIGRLYSADEVRAWLNERRR